MSKLKKLNDSIKELLIKHPSQKLETDSSTVEACVQAISCEPVIECKPNVLELEKYEHLRDNPAQTHHCTKEFVHKNEKKLAL